MLFVFFGLMHEVSNYGYGNIYLWGDWFWMANVSRTLWNAPFIFSALMFTYHLLQVNEFCGKRTHRLYQLLKISFALLFIIALLPLPPYPWRFSVFIFHVVLFAVVLCLLLYSTYKAIKRKYVPAYFFLAGEMTLLIIVLIIGLRNFKIIPDAIFSPYIFIYMGIVAMSFTLFSMVAYTRSMHVKVIKEFIPLSVKSEPKELSETELEKLNTIFTQIEVFISEHKSYLNTELSIKTLSEESEIAEHLLSKAINVKADMHFFDYINSYRIKEACRLLADKEANKKYSIEGLAAQCGFSNKTSFNKAFKKFTGKTPSEFRAGLA
jgi:AraC-like DNA-binding protein